MSLVFRMSGYLLSFWRRTQLINNLVNINIYSVFKRGYIQRGISADIHINVDTINKINKI